MVLCLLFLADYVSAGTLDELRKFINGAYPGESFNSKIESILDFARRLVNKDRDVQPAFLDDRMELLPDDIKEKLLNTEMDLKVKGQLSDSEKRINPKAAPVQSSPVPAKTITEITRGIKLLKDEIDRIEDLKDKAGRKLSSVQEDRLAELYKKADKLALDKRQLERQAIDAKVERLGGRYSQKGALTANEIRKLEQESMTPEEIARADKAGRARKLRTEARRTGLKGPSLRIFNVISLAPLITGPLADWKEARDKRKMENQYQFLSENLKNEIQKAGGVSKEILVDRDFDISACARYERDPVRCLEERLGMKFGDGQTTKVWQAAQKLKRFVEQWEKNNPPKKDPPPIWG